MARKVTLQTIAEQLGVSRTTVSNAYNRPDQLAPELRERVLATAAELGYTGPDPAARRLRSGGREAIGLLFTESLAYAFSDPGAVLFLQGFAQRRRGGRARDARSSRASPAARRRTDGDRQAAVREAVVSGFCAYSLPVDDPDLAAAVERRLPLVVVDEPRTGEHTFVGIDDRAGARLAAEHLTALGHRRIGIVSFRTTDDGYTGPLTPEREAAATYPVTAAAAGRLARRPRGRRDPVGRGREGGARPQRPRGGRGGAARAARARPGDHRGAVLDRPDRARRDGGRGGGSAAADLSIVGFDDIPAAAARDLTTVRQPLLEKGLTAGRLLVDPPEDPEPRRDRAAGRARAARVHPPGLTA